MCPTSKSELIIPSHCILYFISHICLYTQHKETQISMLEIFILICSKILRNGLGNISYIAKTPRVSQHSSVRCISMYQCQLCNAILRQVHNDNSRIKAFIQLPTEVQGFRTIGTLFREQLWQIETDKCEFMPTSKWAGVS